MNKRFISWGHKLHSHTHSYIHYGYERAFARLGFETLWFDDNDDVSNVNFDNCIFFTEGQVDKNIPLNDSSMYITHNCDDEKYQNFKKINIQVFNKSLITGDSTPVPRGHHTFTTSDPLTKINEYTYVSKNTIYQPWATDLLPDEINLDDAHNEMINKECLWIGTYGGADSEYQNWTAVDPFFDESRRNGLTINRIDPWAAPVSPEANKALVNKAMIAPTLQGPWQIKHGYIPCRIFKNISYGHLGVTNNELVNHIFDNKLVYDSDSIILFHKAMEAKKDPNVIDNIKYLMNEVKTKHTFINRAQVILSVLDGK